MLNSGGINIQSFLYNINQHNKEKKKKKLKLFTLPREMIPERIWLTDLKSKFISQNVLNSALINTHGSFNILYRQPANKIPSVSKLKPHKFQTL